jgi:hypothetical protein
MRLLYSAVKVRRRERRMVLARKLAFDQPPESAASGDASEDAPPSSPLPASPATFGQSGDDVGLAAHIAASPPAHPGWQYGFVLVPVVGQQ